VRAETGLGFGATMGDLGPAVWKTMELMSPRLRNFLLFLLRTRWKSVGALRCFDRTWPAGLKVSDIDWTTRTQNCLERADLLRYEHQLVMVTFGELFAIEAMGTMAVLEFCGTLEGVMDCYEQLASDCAESQIGDKSADFLDELKQAAQEEWSAQISSKDPRFTSLLAPWRGTLQDRIELVLGEPGVLDSVADIPLLIQTISRVKRQIIEHKNKPLEECLLNFLALISKSTGARLAALAARLGWIGDIPITLEACGEQLKVTRERIRQIQNSILSRLPTHEVFMPRLDEAIEILERQTPLALDQASKILQEAGITRVPFHPRSILDTAELFHKTTSLRICDTRTGEMLVNDSMAKSVKRVPSIARKLAGQSGVTSLFQVQDMLTSNGCDMDEDAIRRILKADKNFEFIDDDWLWATDIPNERNRLRNVARKILSVVSPQSVLSIREGARRSYRYRAASHERYATLVVPPFVVLKGFLQTHAEFEVQGEDVSTAMPLDYTKELGNAERILVEVLRASPAGVMDRKTFSEGCLVRGMNENTFSVLSTYSSVLEHIGIDIWKLRGVKVDPTAVEAVRIANRLRPREKRVLEYGWSNDGALWIAVRVPRMSKQNIVFGCPGAVQRYLVGQEYQCKTKEGNHDCGTVVFNEAGTSYGYGPFVRRYGLDADDILLAEFDLSTNVVTLSAGTEELLEDET
ncbi:MAG: hypothetical protein MN733_25435, partial [Nitrososphaera sp.]|nr:hypothetical protein [Nitrososphaera sp.]